MEALFSTALASVEAWLMLICVIVFLGVYLLDVVALAERVMMVLRPMKRPTEEQALTTESTIPENTTDIVVESPMLEEITPEEIQAHEEEKKEEEQELIAHQEEVAELEEEVREAIAENPEAVIENIDKIVEESESAIAEEVRWAEEINTTETVQWGMLEDITPTEESIQEEKVAEMEIEQMEEVWTQDEEIDTIEKKDEENRDVEPDTASTELTTEASTENTELVEEKIEEVPEVSQEDSPIATEEITEEFPILEVTEESWEEPDTVESEESATPAEVAATDPEESVIEEKNQETTNTIDETIPPTDEKIEEKLEEIETPETRARIERERNTERLYAITNEVKTLIARGNTHDARALIIQWLALEKNHRELNLILGSLYEWDRQFQKAEFVYKDLALIYPEDIEILEKLANILIIERRYDIALEIYRKIVSLAWETEWSIYIMAHLSHELGHHEELYAYTKRYQKSWPNNPEILALLAEAEIALGERQSAIQTLIKLKNLTPYNAEIMETIAKLTMEEELAGNFGGEKI